MAADRFYLTEYNVGCCLGYPLHDAPAAAAFIFRAVASLNEIVDLYSYWTFTDIFEEVELQSRIHRVAGYSYWTFTDIFEEVCVHIHGQAGGQAGREAGKLAGPTCVLGH